MQVFSSYLRSDLQNTAPSRLREAAMVRSPRSSRVEPDVPGSGCVPNTPSGRLIRKVRHGVFVKANSLWAVLAILPRWSRRDAPSTEKASDRSLFARDTRLASTRF